eukprot:456315-Pleurochrysis_carterae.AAC.1
MLATKADTSASDYATGWDAQRLRQKSRAARAHASTARYSCALPRRQAVTLPRRRAMRINPSDSRNS